jgi:hypothetical protein
MGVICSYLPTSDLFNLRLVSKTINATATKAIRSFPRGHDRKQRVHYTPQLVEVFSGLERISVTLKNFVSLPDKFLANLHSVVVYPLYRTANENLMELLRSRLLQHKLEACERLVELRIFELKSLYDSISKLTKLEHLQIDEDRMRWNEWKDFDPQLIASPNNAATMVSKLVKLKTLQIPSGANDAGFGGGFGGGGFGGGGLRGFGGGGFGGFEGSDNSANNDDADQKALEAALAQLPNLVELNSPVSVECVMKCTKLKRIAGHQWNPEPEAFSHPSLMDFGHNQMDLILQQDSSKMLDSNLAFLDMSVNKAGREGQSKLFSLSLPRKLQGLSLKGIHSDIFNHMTRGPLTPAHREQVRALGEFLVKLPENCPDLKYLNLQIAFVELDVLLETVRNLELTHIALPMNLQPFELLSLPEALGGQLVELVIGQGPYEKPTPFHFMRSLARYCPKLQWIHQKQDYRPESFFQGLFADCENHLFSELGARDDQWDSI